MPACLVAVNGTQVKIELTVELSRSMLASEEAIQVALSEAGCIAGREALGYFDTDSSPLQLDPELWRIKCSGLQSSRGLRAIIALFCSPAP